MVGSFKSKSAQHNRSDSGGMYVPKRHDELAGGSTPPGVGTGAVGSGGVADDKDALSNRKKVEPPPEFTSSEHSTKVTREDVRKIFRPSFTHGTVTKEQVARIRKTHDSIASGVDFNFDYYCLLICASIIAALGLANNSSASVTASMLLSPIMGPVVGMAYGVSIWDWKLVRRSIRNECVSLLICIILGVLVALTTIWTNMAESWLTDEMVSRCTITNLLVGIPVAFFSGLGVALSIGDNMVSSLVGVAISASLLPPAVNCGMVLLYNAWIQAGRIENPRPGVDYRQGAWTSITLTVVNIIMVWLAGMLMFRIKETLPIKKSDFWSDLKLARRIYQHRAVEAEDDGEKISLDPQTMENNQGTFDSTPAEVA